MRDGRDTTPDRDDDSTARVLRRVLGEEAAMVQPTPAPTPEAEPDRSRRWAPALAVAAGVVAVALGGAAVLGVFDDDAPAPVAGVSEEPSPEPSQVLSPAPTDPTAAPEPSLTAEPSQKPTAAATPSEEPTTAASTTAVEVWYVTEYRPGRPALVPETVEVEATEGAEGTVTAALQHLLSAAPEDPDYSNGLELAGGPERLSVQVTDSSTIVDVSPDAFSQGLGSEFAALAVQQLVQTVVSNGGTEPVTVLVDGAAGAELYGALVLDEPLSVDETVRSLGWVTSPAEGAVVDGGSVTITGTATGFEGEIDWEVLDAAEGGVVASGFTGSGANGELGDVELTVDLGPGEYIVRLFEASEAGEGEGPPVVWEDTAQFSVR